MARDPLRLPSPASGDREMSISMMGERLLKLEVAHGAYTVRWPD
jgi:hypothetical protein